MSENAPVTAYISSKDRYFSTLPTAIFCIINQSVRPQRFILFLDGEHLDLRTNDLYLGLFRLLDLYKIKWEVVFGQGKGQVPNHQKAIELAKTDFIWRNDDDCFPTQDVLRQLLSCNNNQVGAIGGLVLDPSHHLAPLPPDIDKASKITDLSLNRQWFTHNTDSPVEVEHLYSTFLFKKSAASHGYCLDLSPAGHREETIFTYEMFRNGWKLLVNPKAITWHIRQSQGGIRTHQAHPEYWDADEKIFQDKLKSWNIKIKEQKLLIINSGKGDHVMFLRVWPQLKERFKEKDIIISTPYPDVLAECGVRLISIAEGERMCKQNGWNFDGFNIYHFCSKTNWKKHLSLAFLELYK